MNVNVAMRLIIVSVGMASIQEVGAVSIAVDNRGQVLLYPYYTAQGTNDTYLSVANHSGHSAKAIKVRFREARNGRVALDFNLYLAANAAWTAAITRDGSGNPILRTYDVACTAPHFQTNASLPGAKEIAFTNTDYANYDMAGSGLDRAREGFVEVIEMGTIVNLDLPEGSLPSLVSPTVDGVQLNAAFNCGAVAAAWQPGGAFLSSGGAELGAPSGDLGGMATIINAPQGTEYFFAPVALARVFSSAPHTAPGSASPNLGHADPISTVMLDGVPTTSTWTRGIDAVSAVLMHQELANEYIAPSPELDAGTDVVMTFPTKSFYVARTTDAGQSTRAPFSAKFQDIDPISGAPYADGASPGACETTAGKRTARSGQLNDSSPTGSDPTVNPSVDPYVICWATEVLTITKIMETAGFAIDNVLGAARARPITSHPYSNSGTISRTFLAQPLISREGLGYRGLPVIGFAAQKYINGNLNGVLSNHGGTMVHRYVTVVR